MFIQKISVYNLYSTYFTGRKSGKKVPNLAQPHIDNCEFGILPQDTQDTIKQIQENNSKIKVYFDALKTKPIKAKQIRDRYEPLIRRTKKQGLTFKNPETDELVTVLQSRHKSTDLLRFIIEGKDSTTHLLIETPNRVIKNIDQNAPYVIPPKFRYMTESEIKASGLPNYAKFIDTEVEKYHKYLQNYDELFPRQKSGPKVGYKRQPSVNPKPEIKTPEVQTSEILTEIQPEVKTYTTKDISKLFSTTTEFPPHVTPTISPRSGQILGLNLTTSKGNTLRVYKSMVKDSRPPLVYVSFVENLQNGNKKYLNFDLDSKEFLYCNSQGKPLIDEDGFLHVYTEEDANYFKTLDRFNEYMNEIFAQNTESRAKVEAQEVIYKTTETTKKQTRIEDIKIEDIEDKRLNKLLDRDKNTILD